MVLLQHHREVAVSQLRVRLLSSTAEPQVLQAL